MEIPQGLLDKFAKIFPQVIRLSLGAAPLGTTTTDFPLFVPYIPSQQRLHIVTANYRAVM